MRSACVLACSCTPRFAYRSPKSGSNPCAAHGERRTRPSGFTTARKTLQAFMPIDLLPVREAPLPPLITRTAAEAYQDCLRALIETERIHDILVRAAWETQRTVPDEKLAFAERIRFDEERPFNSARRAWERLEDELERLGNTASSRTLCPRPLDPRHRGRRRRHRWKRRPPPPHLSHRCVAL